MTAVLVGGDVHLGDAHQRSLELLERTDGVAEQAEHEDRDVEHVRVEVGLDCPRAERTQVLGVRRRPIADMHVEMRVVDVDARLQPEVAERREHAHRVVGGVVVPVEALVGCEVEHERAVEDDGGRRQPEPGERLARRGHPSPGGHEDVDTGVLSSRHAAIVRGCVSSAHQSVPSRSVTTTSMSAISTEHAC